MKTYVQKSFVALALLASLAQAPAQSTNFLMSSTVNAGGNYAQFVLMDVYGHGRLDIVAPNYIDPGAVTVFTNNGSGGFGSNITYSVGKDARWIAATDVNGDGKPDLVTANYGDHTLTVLTNGGSGIFVSNATYAVNGYYPTCVAAVDINGDGKRALVVANEGGTTLTVLTNDGSGSFGFNNTLTVGSNPYFVLAKDINGDNKVDLICANHYSHSLTVLTNDGQGGFSISSSPNTGNEPLSVATADINGDGKLDLISADFGGGSGGGNTLTVLTNAGNGIFGPYATLNVGSSPGTVISADVNGDGKPDLISANTAGSITVLLNNGDGTFARTDFSTAVGCVFVAAFDLNGDGKPDLITANPNSESFTVLTNNIAFPSPGLHIAGAGNQSVLFWPVSGTNYILQSTTNLSSPNWATATDAVPVIAFTVTNSSPARFFRLQSQ